VIMRVHFQNTSAEVCALAGQMPHNLFPQPVNVDALTRTKFPSIFRQPGLVGSLQNYSDQRPADMLRLYFVILKS